MTAQRLAERLPGQVALAAAWHHEACKLKHLGSRQCRWWDVHLRSAAHLLADGSVFLPPLPPRTRLILASHDLLEWLGTRTSKGQKIVGEWGEQTPEGWYEPIFRTTDDGSVLLSPTEAERVRRIEEAAREHVAGLPEPSKFHDRLIDALGEDR